MRPLVSIVIDNYNYAQFLPVAIESAIQQTYSPIEIIVVDDGSTDQSREIISRYQTNVVPIFKQNGGNNSAINAGIKHSHGNIICFLDADDFFFPEKVASVVHAFTQERKRPILVHHLLQIFDESSKEMTSQFKGKAHKSPCNLYDYAKRYRFIPFQTGPTSSISINRALADLLFPLPERPVNIWADDFIVMGASLIGELRSLDCALGAYRVHGRNLWFNVDRSKAYEGIEVLERYLNEKLTVNNRMPIISFGHSMHSWHQLAKEKHWLTLTGHMARLLVVQRDKLTLKFIYDTTRFIFNNTLRKCVIFRWIAESTSALRHGNGARSDT